MRADRDCPCSVHGVCLETSETGVRITDELGRVVELQWADALWTARTVHLAADVRGLL